MNKLNFLFYDLGRNSFYKKKKKKNKLLEELLNISVLRYGTPKQYKFARK